MIGYMPAWRAIPSGAAAAIEGASNAMQSFMSSPVLNPASAASDIAQITAKMGQAAGQAAAAGAPGAPVVRQPGALRP